MRRRPNYSVAVTVVVLTVALAFGANLLRPLVPTPAANPIANYSGDYLKRAATHKIEWLPCDANAFSEARRLDRPVLLFIGMAWSRSAREIDEEVLSVADVQNYLSHNFVCVRVDGNEAPAWVSAYLPISRSAIGIRTRLQIWALKPDGQLIDNINRRLAGTKLGPSSFLDDLIRVHDLYTGLRQRGATSEMELEQRLEVAQIESQSPAPAFDFAAMTQSVQSRADVRNGGFPLNDYQDLRPFAWLYLAQSDHAKLMHDTLMPTLRSRAVDVLDGGFFQTARNPDRSLLEFDKSAVVNAEMASALAQMRSLLRDPGDLALCDYALNRTIESLTTEFRSPSGFLYTARIGDEDSNNRSERSSLSPEKLRNTFDVADREWARRQLGLRVESNPQMTPFLTSTETLKRIDEFRNKVLPSASPAKFTTNTFMDVNATVAARLMEVGRATKNQNVIDIGSDLFTQLDSQRVGDAVPHDLLVSGRSAPTLLDYLAYADAALQDYLSSGRVPSLQNGLIVLQRGLETFAGTAPGEYRVGLPPGSDLLPKAVANAQIVDDLGESASAKVVRLCTAYGRLFVESGRNADAGLELLRIAYATQSLLSFPVASIGISAVSFASACLTLVDDLYAIAVGPDGQQLANELYARRPLRFIAAAFGPARTDLSGKEPGIYIVNRGQVSGPFTVEQAERLLPPTLSAGP